MKNKNLYNLSAKEVLKKFSADAHGLAQAEIDTLDSFKHYTKTGNEKELDYIQKNIEAIFKYKPENYDDKIFDELKDCKI